MVRPKGSKNAVRTKKTNVDYAAIVAEKTTAKEQIETEIAALSDNISVLKEAVEKQKICAEGCSKGTFLKQKGKKGCSRKKGRRRSKRPKRNPY